jgi:hypothetical protein
VARKGRLTQGRILGSVKDGKYVDLVRPQMIDDSVGPLYHLTDLGQVKLRDGPAGQRKGRNLLRASGQTIDSSLSIGRRVLCNVSVDGPKVSKCSVGPVNFHWDSLNSLRTSSTLRVRPASLSARPDSIA